MLLTLGMAASLLSVGASAEEQTAAAKIEGREGAEYATLQQAIQEAQSGDTVTLLRNVQEKDVQIYIPSGAYKELTLDLGGYSIDAQGEGRCLVVVEGSPASEINLTIQNGTLKNGASSGNTSGGAISAVDTLTLENCVVENSSAMAGGGVSVSKAASVVLKGCTFRNNVAGTNGSGGALILSRDGSDPVNTPFVIENCTFENNTAAVFGGGIYLNNAEAVLEGSTFTGNQAAYGGAVAASGFGVTLNNVSMTGNTASTMGGAAHIQNVGANAGKMVVNGGSITENQAAYGGAVSASGADVSIANAVVSENSASAYGGALYTASNTVEIQANLVDNTAAKDGGAIYANKSYVTVRGNMTGNEAGGNGGAVCIYQYALDVQGDLTGNTAKQNGGAVFSSWSEIVLKGTVTGNAAVCGGGLYNAENRAGEQFDGQINLLNASVYNNTASTAGDDLYSGNGNHIRLAEVGTDWVLDSCEEAIDGWYQDGEDARWNGHGDPAQAAKVSLNFQNGEAVLDGAAAVKAAHAAVEKIPDESTPSTGPSSSSAEEIPDDSTPSGAPSDSSNPSTGEDSAQSVLLLIPMLLAFSGIAAVVFSRRKRAR